MLDGLYFICGFLVCAFLTDGGVEMRILALILTIFCALISIKNDKNM